MSKKLRLGLDLGTNSIGWCLLELNQKDEPTGIHKAGVRIFSNGRDAKTYSSLNVERRTFRSARRRRDRFLMRKRTLINALIRHQLMPKDREERKQLELLCPYEIRANALNQKVDPYHLGRALFHLNQRRGFRSNRIADDKKEAGVVHESIAELEKILEDQNKKTFGELLNERKKQNEPVRARRQGSKSSDLYALYPDRKIIEKEFEELWESQRKYDAELYSCEAYESIHKIIFFQRELKEQEVGKCTFLHKESRAAKAHPDFQQFRLYQELDNISFYEAETGEILPSSDWKEFRDSLIDDLSWKRKSSYESIEKKLNALRSKKNLPKVGLKRNGNKRKDIYGNTTNVAMKKALADKWKNLEAKKQSELIECLTDSKITDDDLASKLSLILSLDKTEIKACKEASFEPGYGNLSLAAIKRILPYMKKGFRYYEAVEEAGLGPFNLYKKDQELSSRLSYYGKILSTYVTGASGKQEDPNQKRYGKISNTTVHIVLNQLRHLVNELIRVHGKPYQIVVETGRELPMGPITKNDREKRSRENRIKNEKIRDEIARLGHQPNPNDVKKYRLWEELSKDPTKRCCPFSGKPISLQQLFSSEVEVEHILPFSRTLDDSYANKTLSYRQANRDKGNQTPFEAFGSRPHSSYVWPQILDRAKSLPENKANRFLKDAMDRYESSEEGNQFIARQLNDTRYITRITRQYLATIVDQNQIWGITGQLSGQLRRCWGLENVLNKVKKKEMEDPEKDIKEGKNREDHRHHMIDAIVVASTSRTLLSCIHEQARQLDRYYNNAENDFEEIAKEFRPWNTLYRDVKDLLPQIVISHRTNHHDQGPLHNETAYGAVKGEFYIDNLEGMNMVKHRVTVDKIEGVKQVAKIIDPLIRKKLKARIEDALGDEKTAIKTWFEEKEIKRIRIQEPMKNVVAFKDKNGKYKVVKPDGNAYHDIYELDGKWSGETVRLFDAQQRKFVPKWRRDYPNNEHIMRLRRDDLLYLGANKSELPWSNDLSKLLDATARGYVRVQKISGTRISISAHNEANTDSRSRQSTHKDGNVMRGCTASTLQKLGARKINISTSGIIQIENNDRTHRRDQL